MQACIMPDIAAYSAGMEWWLHKIITSLQSMDEQGFALARPL